MQGVYQAYPTPAGPPAPPRRRNRVLIIALSVVGAFLLVAASLIVALVLTSNGSRPEQTAETVNREAVVNEETEQDTDPVVAQLPEQPEQPAADPDPDPANPGSGQEPFNLLSGLSLFSLSDPSADQQTIQTGADDGKEADIDPAEVRQSFVDELVALGIAETEVADFLAAYDLLVSEDFMAAYAALTAEEQQAYETALMGVLEDYFRSFFADCDFSNILSIETEAEFEADFTACIIASINRLGRDIVAVSQEHGLAPTTETE
ncbi:hypothetical protein F4X86_00110 [Candidatus Saccharibacteria bacterium]|nr:hypothetical protein [Candidatus Saccharibacteria bacterium]